jgi:signal transduction histidine kinase
MESPCQYLQSTLIESATIESNSSLQGSSRARQEVLFFKFNRYRTYAISITAGGFMFLAVGLVDRFLAAHQLHAEATYLDDILLSIFVFGLVFVLESTHQRQRERSRELERTNAELRSQTETVRQLSAHLLRLQDEERRRFARELHDSAGQLLAALNMKLANICAEAGQLSPEGAGALADSIEFVDKLISEIRTISHLLHPPLLDEVGLDSALRWYVNGFAERSRISVSLDIPSQICRLPREMEISLFRIVQEALTNVHRHSGSPSARIYLRCSLQEVRIEIHDAGHGIPPDKQSQLNRGAKAGVGISGMRERARELGGRLEVQSDGSGTTIAAVLPLKKTSAVGLAS